MHKKLEVPSMSVNEAQSTNAIFIDVRTPKEFGHFHIPNAINVPIFTNEERVHVGTVYKQVGQEDAKELGVSIFGKKLPELYEMFQNLQEKYKDQPLIVYCWRGGMRSKSVVTCMSALGFPVFQLEGGIRSYRQKIMLELEEITDAKPFVILSGNTGTGKTDILTQLQEKGYPVIDLEGLANHRGSIFGHIGKDPSNQKQFEENLFNRLAELRDSEYFIIEAESRRIGKVHLPEMILRGKENGTWIHIDADLDFRIQTICRTYQSTKNFEECITALSHIIKRLPDEIVPEMSLLIETKDVKKIVELLLKHYYDPRYLHSEKQHREPIATLHINNIEDGVSKVEQAIHKLREITSSKVPS